MEKSNGKIVAVVALVIAVVSLSVGFAAFAATLTVSSSANVTAVNDFTGNVNYTNGYTVTCKYTGTETDAEGATVGTASGKTWTGISIPLSAEHKSVTCTAQVHNESTYTAYLKQISIANTLSCAATGSGDAAATNVSTFCPTVSATLAVGSDSATFTSTNSTAVNGTGSIATNGYATVTLTVSYTGTVTPDGDIGITIPTISHLYSTSNS